MFSKVKTSCFIYLMNSFDFCCKYSLAWGLTRLFPNNSRKSSVFSKHYKHEKSLIVIIVKTIILTLFCGILASTYILSTWIHKHLINIALIAPTAPTFCIFISTGLISHPGPMLLDSRLFLLLVLRVVTKISSCRVNTTSRRGIKRLGISFGSIFLLFSNESSRGSLS